jgi:hypothetical protein
MAGRFRPLILGLFNSGLVLDHTFADDQKRAGNLGVIIIVLGLMSLVGPFKKIGD